MPTSSLLHSPIVQSPTLAGFLCQFMHCMHAWPSGPTAHQLFPQQHPFVSLDILLQISVAWRHTTLCWTCLLSSCCHEPVHAAWQLLRLCKRPKCNIPCKTCTRAQSISDTGKHRDSILHALHHEFCTARIAQCYRLLICRPAPGTQCRRLPCSMIIV
jgi:hypothetical protein